MMKQVFVFLIIILTATGLNAQKIAAQDLISIQKTEMEMKPYALAMIRDSLVTNRFRADSFFTRTLVKALKTPYSFYYNFDSVITVSKVYAPDSSFKIFTWQLEKDSAHFRQRGAIQINTPDGSLKLFPLFDFSDFTNRPNDSVRTVNNWIGCIYYGIVKKMHNNKAYYTLLGYDDNNDLTTRKWLDILTFDENGTPKFGSNIFVYKHDELKPRQPAYRFTLEYKKNAGARMAYDQELDMIVFEHLISQNNRPDEKYTLIPDGDYEAFKWTNGQWVHVSKIFDYKVDMKGVDPMLGNAPVPVPIKDRKNIGRVFEDEDEAPAEEKPKKEKASKKKKNN